MYLEQSLSVEQDSFYLITPNPVFENQSNPLVLVVYKK